MLFMKQQSKLYQIQFFFWLWSTANTTAPKNTNSRGLLYETNKLLHFCCVGRDGRHAIFYNWTENQAGKGAVEVGSAILHYLRNLELTEDTRLLRMFCDGCAAQNRNNHLLHILLYWLQREAKNVEEILVTFPVRGHSFLPADSLCQGKKKIRRYSVIETKERYNKL